MSTLSTPATLEYYDELARALPAPIPDKPEHRQRRLGTAIEAFQDLHPGNAYEGRLAVQIVLCGDRRPGPRHQRCADHARRHRRRGPGRGRLTGPAWNYKTSSHQPGF